ncbi:hypothetical protein K438DRAFT_2012121 [Mycena galopus ATCC 62051]|nr:hypothetical protein K438DRAFT_2012121 [Mycena galopus ATCC 62051]
MAYLVIPSVFDNYWANMQDEVCTAIIDVLLYGGFIFLFYMAMHLLYYRKTAGRSTLLVLTAVMALLGTAQFSLHIATTSLPLRLLHMAITNGQLGIPPHPTGIEGLYWSLVFAQDVVLVPNIVLTDGLLIYRCYLVWGRPSKVFIVVPILLMLGTLAGRIWWVTRTQRAVFGTALTPQYAAAIAIMSAIPSNPFCTPVNLGVDSLESGAIYCGGLIFQVIALSVQSSTANIVPTLIIVRVGLGQAVDTTTGESTTTAPGPRSTVHNINTHASGALRFASGGISLSRSCGDSEVGIDIGLGEMTRDRK